MFKTIFIIAVAVVGLVEFIKKYLPESVQSKKPVMATIAGVTSVVVACAFVAFNQKIGYCIESTIFNFVAYSVGTVGIVQTSYATLYKVFQAIVKKLKTTYAGEIDADKVAEEIAEKIENKVEETVVK